MTSAQKIVAALAWWLWPVAVVVLLWSDIHPVARRHARWSLFFSAGMIALACPLGAIAGVVGSFIAQSPDEIVTTSGFLGGLVGGLIVLFWLGVAGLNTLAALANKGPFFTSSMNRVS